MQGHAGTYRGIKRNTGEYKEIKGNTGEETGIADIKGVKCVERDRLKLT